MRAIGKRRVFFKAECKKDNFLCVEIYILFTENKVLALVFNYNLI